MIDPLTSFGATVAQGVATGMGIEKAREIAAGPDYDDIQRQERHELFKQIAHDLHKIEQSITADLPDLEFLVSIPPLPGFFKISREGRGHVCFFATSALTFVLNIPGIGQFTTGAQKSGWLQIDLPDGTMVSLASGASAQNILYRATNTALGSVLSW